MLRSLRTLRTRLFATVNGENLFDKILIANRGEISCRVIRSCKELGIKTVAVHSEVDSEALHVRMADEAVCVGPAPSAQSYLVMENIMDAVRQTGAQAVHPGYGFLSENQEFSAMLEREGVCFIGPPAEAIRSMGDKIESKLLAKEAKVTTIPGYMGLIDDEAHACKIATEIGYPVMIKASAGGGGKGMRVAWNDEEAIDGFRLSKDEAINSFGDDRIFIEKYIEEPRHIEIQILADKFGNVVPFPERECSIQRRNQKVIEEAPSMLLDDDTRRSMGAEAAQMARAVNYHSAGTVEFLCDKHKNFYFLEMNTRLQVEHPVTEFITGEDLVYQMIRISSGYELPERLTKAPQPLPINGWSVECRVYAEDPIRGFLPSTGRLMTYIEPEGEGVRVDAGVREGSDINMFYDPLICKLVTHGENRDVALDKMCKSLDTYAIRGLNHNAHFLRDVCAAPRFRSGKITTNYIAEEYPEGFSGVCLPQVQRNEMAAIACQMHIHKELLKETLEGQVDIAKPVLDSPLYVTLDKIPHEIEWEKLDGSCKFTVKAMPEEGEALETVIEMADVEWRNNAALWTGKLNGVETYAQFMKSSAEGVRLYYLGAELDCTIRNVKQQEMAKHMLPKAEIDFSKILVSPMPGTLISIDVEEGDTVQVGQQICVVEAMKMQNILRAEKAGVVSAVHATAGEQLTLDQLIVEYDN